MIYPDVTLNFWTNKYRLPIETKKCAKCRKNFKTSVPILIKGYAGLETPTHKCNRKFNSAIFTPITDKTKKEWESIYNL